MKNNRREGSRPGPIRDREAGQPADPSSGDLEGGPGESTTSCQRTRGSLKSGYPVIEMISFGFREQMVRHSSERWATLTSSYLTRHASGERSRLVSAMAEDFDRFVTKIAAKG